MSCHKGLPVAPAIWLTGFPNREPAASPFSGSGKGGATIIWAFAQRRNAPVTLFRASTRQLWALSPVLRCFGGTHQGHPTERDTLGDSM
jgi:hypothetical protein